VIKYYGGADDTRHSGSERNERNEQPEVSVARGLIVGWLIIPHWIASNSQIGMVSENVRFLPILSNSIRYDRRRTDKSVPMTTVTVAAL
jgi:hypothetical protein